MEKFEDPNITECRPTILMTELQVNTSGNNISDNSKFILQSNVKNAQQKIS